MKTFFDKYVHITHTRTSLIVGGALTTILLAAVLLCNGSYLADASALRILLFIGCLIAPFVIGALAAFRIELRSRTASAWFNTVLFVLLPVVITTMTEALNNVFVYDMTYFGFAANYILTLLFLLAVYALSGSFRLALWIFSPLLFLLSTVNHFMVQYRGSPFGPMDFASLGVADAILEQYSYTIDYQIMTAFLLLCFLIVTGVRMKTPKPRLIPRIIARVVSGAVVAAVMLTFFFTSFFARFDVRPDFWNQARGYRNFGFTYSFFINIKYLYVLEPSDYDPEAVEGYVQDVVAEEEPLLVGGTKPDIICIMNESLADLSALGTVNTNDHPMPFISSLRENTVRGTLYVPVIGAGTANTEFEFLTGNSMAFLPSGSNAYILYANRELPTLATTLRQQGYGIHAMHPYYGTGWNRKKVYGNLGFHEFYSIEDILDMNIFREYQQNGYDLEYLQQLMEQAYPGEQVLMRQYVRDDYNYDWIIDDYENRNTGEPYFMFNVTMQNHGAYRKDASNFDQTIWLTDTDAYPQTDRFLSLIRHSDDAFRDLIAYFETVDRPVLICMFGDHQPSIEDAFVEETLGRPIRALSLEQQQARHATPFLIWANYDIEEAEYEALSSNYLSALLLKTANREMSDYQRYLLKLSETLPVVDTVGYIDADGQHYSWNETSAYSELLRQYERIQYNALLDTENRNDALYNVR